MYIFPTFFSYSPLLFFFSFVCCCNLLCFARYFIYRCLGIIVLNRSFFDKMENLNLLSKKKIYTFYLIFFKIQVWNEKYCFYNESKVYSNLEGMWSFWSTGHINIKWSSKKKLTTNFFQSVMGSMALGMVYMQILTFATAFFFLFATLFERFAELTETNPKAYATQ